MSRFIRRGITKIYFLPAIANLETGPTREEITAGKDITCWPSEISGFTISAESVEVPDLCSTKTKKIPAGETIDDISLTMYEDAEKEEIEETFTRGAKGFIYIMNKGDKPTSKSGDIWPVEVASISHNYSVGSDPATLTVNFTVPESPVFGTAIPVAAA